MRAIGKYVAAIAGLASVAQAVHPVTVQGQEFVDSVTNKRLVVIGVDYQPGGQSGYDPTSGTDALSNGTNCLRDAAILQKLGVNTIRVYNVDPAVNHDDCASIWNAAGIYMIIDVNSPLAGESLDRSNPSGTYTKEYMNRVFSVVEAFKDYKNVLGFFAGNEIINDDPTSGPNPPYIRAIQRDLKNYIAKRASRTIPVGYSAADVRDILGDTWNYLQCQIDGKTDVSRSDFFGLNSYSWCGDNATFESSGYNVLTDLFTPTTIPVFFSEYGCNLVKPRVFDEVLALYGDQMTVLSGGLVYEYSEEVSDFGLVVINDNSTISLRVDFDNLQTQYNKLNISLIESANGTATKLTPPECSSALITNSAFNKSFHIPDPPSGVQDLINNGVSGISTGKLVSVTQTAMPVAVYDTNGQEVQGLVLNILSNDNTNVPGNSQLNGTSSSGGKKKNAGSVSYQIAPGAMILMGLVAVLML